MTAGRTDTLIDVVLTAGGSACLPPHHDDQRQAASDIGQEGSLFALPGQPGPYILHLSMHEGRLQFDVRDREDRPLRLLVLSLRPLRRIISEYRLLIDAYETALGGHNATQLQTIDMGRRGLHDEGARLVIDRLRGKAELDVSTARRLFALIALL